MFPIDGCATRNSPVERGTMNLGPGVRATIALTPRLAKLHENRFNLLTHFRIDRVLLLGQAWLRLTNVSFSMLGLGLFVAYRPAAGFL